MQIEPPPQSLHWLLRLPWLQIEPPPHSLHELLMRACGHMAVPLHSLQVLLTRPCSHTPGSTLALIAVLIEPTVPVVVTAEGAIAIAAWPCPVTSPDTCVVTAAIAEREAVPGPPNPERAVAPAVVSGEIDRMVSIVSCCCAQLCCCALSAKQPR